tara:strand:+ start:240865 stop:242121 length:1257 start_codon:yes stop_codon:yes gene_type:complete
MRLRGDACSLTAAFLAIAVVSIATLDCRADELSSLMHEAPARSSERSSERDKNAGNAVLRLQRQIESGNAKLASAGPTGYLADLLAKLQVPTSSQNLVFSKTSLQQIYIGPTQPRAIYFNDDVYVAYVVDGRLIEIAVADPVDGTQFYMMPQSGENAGRLLQQDDNCLRCHHGGRTEGVAGHIAQSVIVGKAGEPRGIATNNVVDHTTPLADRWGGWYVTGTHRPAVHLGNYLSTELLPKKPTQPHEGVNLTDVSDRFDGSLYLSAESDIVAMLIREHQTRGHNLLSKVVDASFASDEELDEAIDAFVKYVLFIDEAKLPGPIKGTTTYADQFQRTGPRDSQGRSLRQFDLESRLLRYRCSYLIYSETFKRLPEPASQKFWKRFIETLGNRHWIKQDEALAIEQIIRETVPDIAEQWP